MTSQRRSDRLLSLSHELLGVIEDVKHTSTVDEVCMHTLHRVRAGLADLAALENLEKSDIAECVAAVLIVEKLAEAIPLRDTLRATRTGVAMVEYFKQLIADREKQANQNPIKTESRVSSCDAQSTGDAIKNAQGLTVELIDRFEASLSDLGPATRAAASLVCAQAKSTLHAPQGGK